MHQSVIYRSAITSVIDIVKQMRSEQGITILEEETDVDVDKVYIDVRRDVFLKDAFRECKKAKFDPKKLLRICSYSAHVL